MKPPSPALLFSSLLVSVLALSSSGLLCAQAFEPKVITAGHRPNVDGIGIPFIANHGQTDAAVAYYAQTFAGTVFVTRDGRIVYSLPGKSAGREGKPHGRRGAAPASAGWSLTEEPVGATGGTRPAAQKRAQTQVSYFLGNDPSAWRSGIATYEGVSLGQVWPGVTVSLRAHGRNVEKLFTVEPGADPSRIRMRVSGARSLVTDPSGALVASTGPGDVKLTPPTAYQEQGGARRAVAVAYEASGDSYGFRLGAYDPGLSLVIDPLLQSTYLGGNVNDSGFAIAIHPTSGDVYVAGDTDSFNFPGTAGGAQPTHTNGFGADAFIARLNAALTTLIQATYLGGIDIDTATAIAIHPTSGDVYVAGRTASASFPGTTGGAQAAFGGGIDDVFVSRLSAALTTLIQSTYLGGNSFDQALAIAIHPTSGDVYVAGETAGPFPGTVGGAQPSNGGGLGDGFISRLSADLTTLKQSTYLGGSGIDLVIAVAIHPTSGDVYAAGNTASTNLPGTAGGAQASSGGGADAFVSRLNAALTTLTQSTYLGGSGNDGGNAVAIHPTSGDVYVAGNTASTNFPGTAGGAQASSGGGTDAFISRLNPALTTLTQSTYLGGGGFDQGQGLAIHPTSGDVYVTGFTASTNLPGTAGGAQASDGGGFDAFVSRLNPTLTTLVQSTYLGGSSYDQGNAVAIHPTSGDVYVVGFTQSTNFPVTAGGAQPAKGGGAGNNDAFVARLTADLAGAAPPTPTPTPTVTPTSTPTPTPTATPTPGPGAGRVAIPTLDSRGLIALALILAAIGAFAIRRMSA